MKKTLMFALIALAGAAGATDWNAVLTNRVEVLASGYTATETLTNFPVLVTLAENSPAGFSYAQMKADGSDLRFTLGDEALPHEIDAWDPSGTSRVWVRVPRLTASTTRRQFLMRWGQAPGATLPANDPTQVWADDVAVFHMNGGAVVDATGHGFGVADAAVTAVDDAPTGAGVQATADVLVSDWETAYPCGATFTVSAWFKTTELTGGLGFLNKKTMGGAGWSAQKGYYAEIAKTMTALSVILTGSTKVSVDLPKTSENWSQLTIAATSGKVEVRLNGESVAESATTINASDCGFLLMAKNLMMDEARISPVTHSAAWTKAEYDQITDSANFLSFGEMWLDGVSTRASSGATVTMGAITQADDRTITIPYTLANGPAIVTLEVKTNGAAVAASDLWTAAGDVNCEVATGDHAITWRPDVGLASKSDAMDVRLVVWERDDAPDYMAVDLSPTCASRVRYYVSSNAVPGGVLAPVYRTTSVLMRKIPAKGVAWMMGTPAGAEKGCGTDETYHAVTLDHNYYIGVFETTQAQWEMIMGGVWSKPSYCAYPGDWAMRPVEFVCYDEIRTVGAATSKNPITKDTSVVIDTASYYPAAPCATSFLGRLRERCGGAVDFDLPSEAEWEFAARAGWGTATWGDGTDMTTGGEELAALGRHQANCGVATLSYQRDTTSDATTLTAVCGSYAPNGFGLYDMFGNVYEWCLDWYAADYASETGAVNVTATEQRVRRGGSFYQAASACRPAARGGNGPTSRNNYNGYDGFRLAARNGLKSETKAE